MGAQFRRENDVKLIQAGPSGPLPKVIPSDVIPSFAYGRKSRPSTPIASVVGGHYAAESEEMLEHSYNRYSDIQGDPNGKYRVRLTKAANSRIAGARSKKVALGLSEEPKQLFKLSKFK